MLEAQSAVKLFSQASEPHPQASLINHCSIALRQLNGKQNKEKLLAHEGSHQRVRKPDTRKKFSPNIEGETQERLCPGSPGGGPPSVTCYNPRKSVYNRERCASTPKKFSRMWGDFSHDSTNRNITNDSPIGLAKVKPKLFRNMVSASSQCLLMVAWATVVLCGEVVSAHAPSCVRCDLKPTQSHSSSFDERLKTPRQEARMKATDLVDDFSRTEGSHDLPSEGSGLISEGPSHGGGRLGQLCGPRLSCGLGLECRYSVPGTLGVCREAQKLPCNVNGTTYDDGVTFHPDCRTQCTCTGGTYACVSLCPEESRPPSAACRNPALQTSGRRCCRQWTCDPDPDTMGPDSPQCEASVSRWSACSSLTCGLGLSQRWATDQISCRPVLQTRLCQLRPCRPKQDVAPSRHLRRTHHCKATIRTEKPQRLVAGPCVSQRRYRVKRCNSCPGTCCSDFMDTSLEVPFLCPLHSVPPYLVVDASLSPVDQASLFDAVTDPGTQEGRLGDLTVDGDADYTNVTAANFEVVVKQVQWIVRCRCTPTCQTPQMLSTTSTTLDPEFSFGQS